jgi:hypothetical protein
MLYQKEWKRLAAAIRGLTKASQLTADLYAGRNQEAAGAYKDLANAAESITGILTAFGLSLPIAAADAKSVIERASKKILELLATGDSGPDFHLMNVKFAIVMLGRVESQLSYLLADREAELRSLTERAFEHLQRTIVVDIAQRKTWVAAWENHETECEKLGAIHLLAHGIWAFKATANGGHTDLVYQEPIRDLGAAIRASEGLVLTEWKRLPKAGGDVDDCFKQARAQAKLYAAGVLGGSELRRTRYAVLVSGGQVSIPPDVIEGEVTYRHINIAVAPQVPSKAARAASR